MVLPAMQMSSTTTVLSKRKKEKKKKRRKYNGKGSSFDIRTGSNLCNLLPTASGLEQ